MKEEKERRLTRADPSRLRSRDHVRSIVHHLPTLAISTNNKFGIRTLRLGLRDQSRERGAPSRVAAFEKPIDGRAVVDALDRDVGGADEVRDGLEKRRAGEGAYVALLCRPSGEEDRELAAGGPVRQLVFGVGTDVLAGLQRGEGDGRACCETDEGEEGEVELHGWVELGLNENELVNENDLGKRE